jgi:hypothetical protein
MYFHAILPLHCTHKHTFIVNFHVFWLFSCFLTFFARSKNAALLADVPFHPFNLGVCQVDWDKVIPRLLCLNESMDSSCKVAMLWSSSSWQTESIYYDAPHNFSYDRQSPPPLQLSSQGIAAAASVPFAHGIHQWLQPAFRPSPLTSIPVIPCIQLRPPPTQDMLISDPGLCHSFTKPEKSTVAQVS